MTKVSKKLEDASKRPTNHIEYIKYKKRKKSNKARASFRGGIVEIVASLGRAVSQFYQRSRLADHRTSRLIAADFYE